MKWFSVPVDEIFSATADISGEWRDQHESIARSILDLGQEPQEDLGRISQIFQLRAFMVLDQNGHLLRSAGDPGVLQSRLPVQILSALGDRAEAFIEIDPYWIGVRNTEGPHGKQIIAAVFPAPQRIIELTSKIAAERANYSALVQNQKFYRDIYVAILLIMTVLVLFAAVWTGLFLSKRITIPIEALSEATREISAGNLDHRVDIQAQDELGLLVTLFNDMAEQLQTTTRELEARRRYMEIILESIPTGVISVDPELRVNKINRAARTMFPALRSESVTASVEGSPGEGSIMADTLDQIFSGADLASIRELLCNAETSSARREMTNASTTSRG